MLCSPESVLQQSAQVLSCVGLCSEWSQSASEPLDIESQQLRARCASPRVSVIVHLFSEGSWLAGWMTQEHVPSPPPSPCVCVRARMYVPFIRNPRV